MSGVLDRAARLAVWALAAAGALAVCLPPGRLFAAPFPGTLTWQARANIPGGIEGAAGAVIGGKLYVSHGLSAGDSAAMSVYDIATDTWAVGPSAAVARAELAGGVAGGRYYAIGGRTGPNATVEAFDPVTGLWTAAAPLSAPRGGLGAASLGGLIYAVGGRTGPTFGSGAVLGTNEVYDAVTNTWTILAPMPTPLSDVYATVAFGDKVYVFGGASGPVAVSPVVQVYDPATATWLNGAPMPTARAAAMAGVLCGQIVVFGGFDPITGTNLSVTEVYDPADNTWSAGPPMLQPTSEMAQGPTQTAYTVYAVGNGIFGAAGTAVQALVATGCASAEHYMLYKVRTTKQTPKFTKFGPILLFDQFGNGAYNVIKPMQLGLPAEKNGEFVRDPVTHLKEYKVIPRARPFVPPPFPRIVNQCNDLVLSVKKPVSLLVPAHKNLFAPVSQPTNSSVDHFLCYQAKSLAKLPKGIQVDVADQFEFRRYDLKKITKLCNPVEKAGAPVLLAGPNKGTPKPIAPATIQSPIAHLVCYKATVARKYIFQHGCGPVIPGDRGSRIDPKQPKHVRHPGMYLNDQFGPEWLDSIKENELCIPSLKNPRCGDDFIDGPGEECDGTDSAACPGNCRADCLCPVCGNGVQEPGEECDMSDDAACPGRCLPNRCVCTPPCTHDKCVEGPPLIADCEPCVTSICAQDPFCCNVEWDATCVAQVAAVCGESCP